MARDEVSRRAERMLVAAGRPEAELSILLCDDGVMAELNHQYRHEKGPTDVLAFAMHEGEGPGAGTPLLGDVVVSVDTARRQARDRGHTIREEITTLLAHGILHLLGYDHRTRAEERRMNALTDGLKAAASARSDRPRPRG
ncbi:MAG: rRNA maturation RNase YbeY [Myxococcota bacterium]